MTDCPGLETDLGPLGFRLSVLSDCFTNYCSTVVQAGGGRVAVAGRHWRPVAQRPMACWSAFRFRVYWKRADALWARDPARP